VGAYLLKKGKKLESAKRGTSSHSETQESAVGACLDALEIRRNSELQPQEARGVPPAKRAAILSVLKVGGYISENPSAHKARGQLGAKKGEKHHRG